MWQEISNVPEKGVFAGWSEQLGLHLFYVGNHHGEKRFYDPDGLENGNYIRIFPTHFVDCYPFPNGFKGIK